MSNPSKSQNKTSNGVKIKKGEKAPNLLVNSIEVKPLSRGTSDIDLWRNALRQADKGNRKSLYNLYSDLMIDNVLYNSIDTRVKAITNSEITFTGNDGSEVSIDDLIDTSAFEELLTEIMLAQFWGISVVELEFKENGLAIHTLPRTHILPKVGEVALAEGDERGVPYRDDPYIMEIGRTDDFGLILRAAPFVIYKRNNAGDWAQYIEIFGRPIRVFTYETYDEQARIETTKAAEKSGGNLTVVMPANGGFDVKAGAVSGDGEIFDKKRRACNEEILIGILGQTLTTTQGSVGSQALGSIHWQVQEAKHKADRRFVQRILNTKLIPILARQGYPVEGGYFLFPEQGERLGLVAKMDLIDRASKLVPIGSQHVYDSLGIPRPEEGEELVANPQPNFIENIEPSDDLSNPATAKMMGRILRFFADAPKTGAKPTEINDADNLEQRVNKRVANGQARRFDCDLFAEHSAKLLSAFTSGFVGNKPVASLDVAYGWQSPAVLTAMENNLFRFSAGKTIAQVQQLNQAYRSAKSFEEFEQVCLALNNKYYRAWAKTEYITAGAVAESTATYHRLMSQTEIFPYWEYKTLDDGKVRPEHVKLHGLVLPANDPLWQKIYPPNGWRCRCYVVPRMRHEAAGVNFETMRTRANDYLKSDEYERDTQSGFGTNRAVQSLVFTENQNYVDLLLTNKTLNTISVEDWGLDTMIEQMKQAITKTSQYIGTAKDWKDGHLKDDKITISDLQQRPYIVNEYVFKTHTNGKYASGANNRIRLLNSITEVLGSPDEIWLNAEKNKLSPNNRNYIKYYQNETIVVCTKVVNGELQIHSWFALDKNAENEYRRGMLIKKATPK